MRFKLLVDSDEFWKALQQDICSAQNKIYVQTLSFEGDVAGKKLADLLISLNSPQEIKIIVDSYTRYVLNDRFLYTPKNLMDNTLREERRETHRMIGQLRGKGIEVKFVQFPGFMLRKMATRDHKKIIVVDDKIAYIGGINFSEHNFHWHDCMLRIEDENIARFLSEDFQLTWEDVNYFRTISDEEIELFSFDGRTNPENFQIILDLIGNSEKEIWVHSPYLSFPFLDKLAESRRRGVTIHIISPEDNNRKFLKEYITWESQRHEFNLWLYSPKMSHLKAMLIDDKYLLLGSTNFDYLSYKVHPELLAVIKNRNVIQEFNERVLKVDLKNSIPGNHSVSNIKGKLLRWQMHAFGKITTTLGRL